VKRTEARGGGAARLHHRIRAANGMVTAEFAVGLLAVVPLVLSLVALVAAGATQIQVQEAARTGARLLARGEGVATVQEQVRAVLPAAAVTVVDDGGFAVVDVRQPMGGRGLLPGFTLHAEARTPRE
jgi:hypothetical protein